ncbi:MAG: hypothetical protein ACE15C_13190 [Phycisphaerae bacterium]
MVDMEEAQPISHSQRSLLAVVMLVILLACVAAAWWLSQTRNAGPSIIDEMRRTGLRKLWGPDGRTDFYVLADAGGQPLGWWAVSRWPTDDGYAGETFVRTESRAQIDSPVETWKLSDDARQGQYTGASIVGRTVLSTSIALADGEVVVAHKYKGVKVDAQDRAPANYIPEGSLDLVVRLVQQQGREARFAMLFDTRALAAEDGRAAVTFTPVRMVPQQGGAVRMEFQTEEGSQVSVFHIDAEGRVDKVEEFVAAKGRTAALSSVRKLVSPDEIEAMFPNDDLLTNLVEKAKSQNRSTTSQAVAWAGR